MKSKLSLFSVNGWLIIIAMWVICQVIWYLAFGVHFSLESEKYIGEAQYVLSTHQLSQFRYIFYFSTIAVIAFSSIVHIGLYGALFIIMLINLLSYLYFFKALKHIFSDRLSPYLVIGILMSFWPYQTWSLYLYTECLFYSMVVFLLSHLMLYKTLNFRFLNTVFLLLALVIISRPLGILFVLPTLLFLFTKLSRRQKLFFYGGVILFCLLLNFVVQIVFTTTSDWNMVKALTDNGIICNMPRSVGSEQLHLSQNPNQLYQLFYYVTHNFSHFWELAIIRLKYFFTLVRDYYSSFHNLYLIAYLVVIYGSIVVGIKNIIRQLPSGLSWFIFSSILLFSISIALQCDDYHNRFFLTLMPFFILMFVMAWRPILSRIHFLEKQQKKS